MHVARVFELQGFTGKWSFMALYVHLLQCASRWSTALMVLGSLNVSVTGIWIPAAGQRKCGMSFCAVMCMPHMCEFLCVCLCAFPRCQPGDNVRSHLLSELAGMVGNGVPWLHKVGYTITSQRLICSGHAVMSSTARKCWFALAMRHQDQKLMFRFSYMNFTNP